MDARHAGLLALAAFLPLSAPAASAGPPPTSGLRSARGALPDPDLLDGSKLPPERRSDYGMLGEFDLPGDDAKGDKVGGQPDPAGRPQNKAAQMDQPEAKDQKSAEAGGAQDQKKAADKEDSAAAGGGQDQSAKNASGGGAAVSAGSTGQGGGGGSSPGGVSVAIGATGGQNDPNAKAEGLQVAALTGAPQGGGGDVTAKPAAIALGDSTMQIKPYPSSKEVVGSQAQVAGNTQQMESAIGGRGGAGASSGRGGGVEKGEAMPKGL